MDKLKNNKGQPNSCPLLFLLICLALISACSQKQRSSEIKSKAETQTSALTDDLKKTHFKSFVNQAKESDISTPVGYKLIKFDTQTPDTSFFVYQGSSELETVIKFYTRELELSGWSFKNLSTKQEGLLVANKISKMSVISIRPQELGGSKICISILNENKQEDSPSLESVNKSESY